MPRARIPWTAYSEAEGAVQAHTAALLWSGKSSAFRRMPELERGRLGHRYVGVVDGLVERPVGEQLAAVVHVPAADGIAVHSRDLHAVDGRVTGTLDVLVLVEVLPVRVVVRAFGRERADDGARGGRRLDRLTGLYVD